MQAVNGKRTAVRLAGILTVMAGLTLSGGSTLALSNETGLTECDQSQCRIVTAADLNPTVERDTRPAAVESFTYPSGRFDPRFTR